MSLNDIPYNNMNKTLQCCVYLPEAMAAKGHITYEAINALNFEVIRQAVFMLLCWII